MTEPIRYDWNRLTAVLHHELLRTTDGVTLVQIIELLRVPEHVARQTINKLRESLDSNMMVVAAPHGRERRYCLAAHQSSVTAEAFGFDVDYVTTRLQRLEVDCRVRSNGAQTDDAAERTGHRLYLVSTARECLEELQDDLAKDDHLVSA